MKKVESREHSSSQPADRRALAEINDLIDDGVYEAASVLAWDVQRRTPGDPEVWLLLTRIDYLRERYAAAMYAARMATRLDPSSAAAWLWLARTGATRARWRTEALDAALQATALGPSDPQTWTVLAQLHLARDARYEAAIAAERAVRVGPTDVVAVRTLGEIALRAEEWGHAAAAYRKALELDADDEPARVGLAEALRAQGIDPAEELSRYGTVPRRRGGTSGRVRRTATRVARDSLDLSDPGPLRAHRRGLLGALVACLALGAAIGVAVPGLGVIRGLVGAMAVALMWVAIWPVQHRRPVPVTARAVAGDAAGARSRTRPARAPSSTSRWARARSSTSRSDGAASPRETITSTPREQRTAAASGAQAPSRRAPAKRRREAEEKPEPQRGTTPAPAWDGRPAVAATGTEPAGAGPAGAEPAVAESAAAPSVGPPSPAPAARARTMRARADRARLGRMTGAPGARGAVSSAPTTDEGDAGSDQPPGPAAANGTGGGAASGARPPAGDGAPPPAGGDRPDETAQATDDLPSDPAELVALSSTKLAEFDLPAARTAAERLAELAPDSLESHRALAAVSLAEQDYVQAELHYAKVLDIEPLDQEAHEHLAMARKGRHREQQPPRRRRKG
jgi:tetratricopeptide (TPR) repeat protein